MRRERLLPVATLLERAEYFFKICLHAPLVRRDELREAHCLKVHKACGNVFLEKLRGFRQGLVIGIGSHHEVGRGAVICALQDTVERGVPVLNYFAALRLLSMCRAPIAQSFGSDFFGPPAQARTNIFPRQAKWPSFLVNSPNRDVNVGMLSVVVDGSDPLNLCA